MASIRENIQDDSLIAFLNQHSHIDPDTYDFHAPQAITAAAPEDTTGALRALAAYRRLQRVGAGKASAYLIEQGLDSAQHITAVPEQTFVERHAQGISSVLGVNGEVAAREMYWRAAGIRTLVAHAASNLRDVAASPALKDAPFNNSSPQIVDFAQSLPGYEDLFGSLDFCKCPQCRSLLGPAAYFVDIMRVTDQYITQRNKAIPTGYTLLARRPDLFKLPLTCANTNDQSSYLSQVNEILATRIAADGVADIDRTLATARYPFNTPFNLRLARLRANLQRLGGSLAQAFSVVLSPANGVNELDIARETVGLSPEQYALITQPAPEAKSLAVAFGYGDDASKVPAAGAGTVSLTANSTAVVGAGTSFGTQVQVGHWLSAAGQTRRVASISDPTHLQVDRPFAVAAQNAGFFTVPDDGLQRLDAFMWRTGLDMESVVVLLGGVPGVDETPGPDAAMLFINATGEGLPPMRISTDTRNPDQPFAFLEHVSPMRFDHINRFVRLAQVLGWDFPSVDCGQMCSGSADIGADTIRALAVLKTLRGSTGATVDVLCSFWSNMPIGGFSQPGPKRLFDEVYNNPAVLKGRNPYAVVQGAQIVPFDPLNPDHRLAWTVVDVKSDRLTLVPGSDTPSNAEVRSRLLGALGVSEADLSTIGRYLGYLLRQDLTPPGTFVLQMDLPTMTWLYRLAKWPALFKMPVDEFLQLLCILYYPEHNHLQPPPGALKPSPAMMMQLASAVGWLAASPFNVYEVQYILLEGALGASKYVNPGYRLEDIGPFLRSTSEVARATFVTPAALVLEKVAPPVAGIVFDQLLKGEFLSKEGIFLDRPIDEQTIAYVYYLYEGSFVTADFIDGAASAQVFAQLVAKGVLQMVMGQGYASVRAEFGPQTSLDFLFPDDPQAALKRSQVRSLLQLFSFDSQLVPQLISQTVGILVGDKDTPGLRVQQCQTLVEALARFLRCDADVMALLPPLNTAGGSQVVGYLASFLATDAYQHADGEPAAVIARLARALLLVRNLQLGLPEIAAIVSHPANFGLPDLKKLSFADLQTLSTFSRLNLQFRSSQKLLAYLTLSAATPAAQCIADLADLAGWDAVQLEAMVDYFWQSATNAAYRTLGGIAQLDAVFSLAAGVRSDVTFLRDLGKLAEVRLDGPNPDAAWQMYQAAADATSHAIQSKFGSEFDAVSAELAGQIASQRRDRLVAYARWRLQPLLGDHPGNNNLYQYLLVDVEMSDCDSTSPVALGIASAQLYMQRCRLRLETGVDDLSAIPDVWWEWMSRYQVWVANRRIFLYPESYIDPALRTSATDPFCDLQSELLQGRITLGSVDAAFRQYFDSFAKLSNLVYVDSYGVAGQDGTVATGVIHVIGRTMTTPYTYYRRTYEPAIQRWGQWIQIDLAIKASTVTPVMAYGRLYLFWADIEERVVTAIANGSESKTTNSLATISYSFMNNSGTWVPVQELVRQVVVKVSPDTYTGDLALPYISPNQIKVSDPWWHKPYLLKVPAQTDHADPASSQPERLMVVLGSVYTLPDSSIEVPAPPTDTDPDLLAFNTGIYQATNRAEQTVVNKLTRSGYIFLAPAALLPPSLRQSERYLITLDYNDLMGDPQPFSAGLDRFAAQMLVTPTKNVFYDNNFGGLVNRTGSSASRAMLFNIDAEHASMIPVKNLPGWCIFSNGDEAFLMAPTDKGIRSISDTLTVGKNSVSGQGNEIDVWNKSFTTSPQLFADLKFAVSRLTTDVVGPLSERLFVGGIEYLLTIEAQRTPELPFERFYPKGKQPDTLVVPPLDEFDRLDFAGAYGPYLREIFFHGPFLIASQLASNQRFKDALHWLQFVFDPTHAPESGDKHPNDRFWRYLPFRSLTPQSLADILKNQAQIQAYNEHPFDPDVIADLRPTAYQKAVVMKYIDILLAWGDALFAQDTRESINAATNLYVMAQDLLGPRPRAVGLCPDPAPLTFAQIAAHYPSGIPQFYIELEHSSLLAGVDPVPTAGNGPINDLPIYFCVPENAELVGYWDKVEDRLFKIRHCMNLDGVERSLALFAPPIDPRALIRAASAGASGMQVAAMTDPPIPHYRFDALITRAKAVASSVSQLGNALLSALEKKDAEALALLRVQQEKVVLGLTTKIREWQIEELDANATSLGASRQGALDRQGYYAGLLAQGLSAGEQLSLDAMALAFIFNLQASIVKLSASIAYALPNVGSPFAMTYGGRQLGSAVDAASGVFELGAMIANFISTRSATTAGYDRRAQEWQLQARLATDDLAQIEAQIQALGFQRKAAEQELAIHLTTIEQNADMERFLSGKFTNQQLYEWMVGQISTIYFQAYTLALKVARSAQRAYQFELDNDRNFIAFGYWDDLHKGLTAGDALLLSLDQLEQAYLDKNARPREIERTISLLDLEPQALLDLQRQGECIINLPESLFDQDFPGHYCRKIKSISLSIPAVLGPYQSIKATLTQLHSDILLQPNLQGVKYLLGDTDVEPPGPAVLRSNWLANQQVCLSRTLNDSGMFELNFRDERYLPFEGTGAVSSWRLSIPRGANRFDLSALSNVVITLNYTALDGGTAFRDQVLTQPAIKRYQGARAMFLSQNYPQAWFAFTQDHGDPARQTLAFRLPSNIVPAHVDGASLDGFLIALQVTKDGKLGGAPFLSFALPGKPAQPVQLTDAGLARLTVPSEWGSVTVAEATQGDTVLTVDLTKVPGFLKGADGFLDPQAMTGIVFTVAYHGDVEW